MKYIITVFLLSQGLSLSAQRTNFILPNDPIRINSEKESNWLKKTTEGLVNSDGNVEYGNLISPLYSFLSYRNALNIIAKSDKASDLVFQWARPTIIAKINSLNLIEKIKLHNMLRDLISYLSKLDQIKEQQYMDKASGLFASRSSTDFFGPDFNEPFPDIICNENRDSEAFLFRRMHEGVNRDLILKYVKLVYSFVDVNVSGTFTQFSNMNLHKCTFTWNKDHFEGDYTEYSKSIGFSSAYRYGSDGNYYTTVTGNYKNGLANGNWKYYEVMDNKRILTDEVEFDRGDPLTVIDRTTRTIKGIDNKAVNYDFVLSLDLKRKVLTADVYKEKQFFLQISSLDNNIDFWDFYGTCRVIENKLPQASLLKTDISFKKNITVEDKPKVQRDQLTGNYLMYDKLKRSGKDHALFIATDVYDHNFENLRNPVRDAEFIADNLQTIYGFKNEIVRNPGKQQLLTVLKKYQKMAFADDEQLLIYISGHGSYELGERDGYIVLKNSQQPSSDVNHETWLSYTNLLDNINLIPSKHILIMIDACHSGALMLAADKLKGIGNDDDFNDKVKNTIPWFYGKIGIQTRMYITSTTADRQTTDGINHSPFTFQFVYALRKFMNGESHIMTLHELFGEMESLDPSPTIKDFKGNKPGSSFFFVMK